MLKFKKLTANILTILMVILLIPISASAGASGKITESTAQAGPMVYEGWWTFDGDALRLHVRDYNPNPNGPKGSVNYVGQSNTDNNNIEGVGWKPGANESFQAAAQQAAAAWGVSINEIYAVYTPAEIMAYGVKDTYTRYIDKNSLTGGGGGGGSEPSNEEDLETRKVLYSLSGNNTGDKKATIDNRRVLTGIYNTSNSEFKSFGGSAQELFNNNITVYEFDKGDDFGTYFNDIYSYVIVTVTKHTPKWKTPHPSSRYDKEAKTTIYYTTYGPDYTYGTPYYTIDGYNNQTVSGSLNLKPIDPEYYLRYPLDLTTESKSNENLNSMVSTYNTGVVNEQINGSVSKRYGNTAGEKMNLTNTNTKKQFNLILNDALGITYDNYGYYDTLNTGIPEGYQSIIKAVECFGADGSKRNLSSIQLEDKPDQEEIVANAAGSYDPFGNNVTRQTIDQTFSLRSIKNGDYKLGSNGNNCIYTEGVLWRKNLIGYQYHVYISTGGSSLNVTNQKYTAINTEKTVKQPVLYGEYHVSEVAGNN